MALLRRLRPPLLFFSRSHHVPEAALLSVLRHAVRLQVYGAMYREHITKGESDAKCLRRFPVLAPHAHGPAEAKPTTHGEGCEVRWSYHRPRARLDRPHGPQGLRVLTSLPHPPDQSPASAGLFSFRIYTSTMPPGGHTDFAVR